LGEMGERLLKGLEGFLRKEGGGEEKGKGKMEKWEKVVGRVEVKFGERVREVEGDVHRWYMGVREREVQEVGV
jgi:hypothetical protein